MFGISERQFANYYKKAVKASGNTAQNMLLALETRLDVAVLRANFARTIMQARQFVSHAHVLVNGKKVNIPSYALSVGDVIEVRENKKDLAVYKSLKEEFAEFIKDNKSAALTDSQWLTIDADKLTITIAALPGEADFDKSIDITKIIEFYSK